MERRLAHEMPQLASHTHIEADQSAPRVPLVFWVAKSFLGFWGKQKAFSVFESKNITNISTVQFFLRRWYMFVLLPLLLRDADR